MDEASARDDIEQQITDDTISQRSSSSLGVAFDAEFVAKVARCKMQYPDMFVSDFFNDDSGIYPQPDLERDLHARMLWAAEHGKLSVVQELCNANPNLVNARDADEYTPLHRACYNNHADVVKFLIDHNAQLDAKTEDGWQPLHSAARWGSFNAAQLLIETAKVDINATTNGLLTPLHLAASSAEPGAVQVATLLLHQPSIMLDTKDKAGDTPYDLARQNSAEMMQLFPQSMNERSLRNVAA